MIGGYKIAAGQMIMAIIGAYLIYKETRSWSKDSNKKSAKKVKKTSKKRR